MSSNPSWIWHETYKNVIWAQIRPNVLVVVYYGDGETQETGEMNLDSIFFVENVAENS